MPKVIRISSFLTCLAPSGKSPTPHAVPYGIVILQNNTPFFCEFGTNKLASIDPSTMKIREYTLPAAGAHPRRKELCRFESCRAHQSFQWLRLSTGPISCKQSRDLRIL